MRCLDHPRPDLRPAGPEDVAVAVGIYVDSSNAAFSAWQPRIQLDEVGMSRWTEDLAKPGYRWWIAEINGRAVGLAGIGPSRDPVGEAIGELDTIAVVPAWWRRGIGRALMAVANDHLDLDGYERAVLWTWAGYHRAAAFYPSVGWTRTQTFRDGGRQVCYSRARLHLPD